MPKRVNILPESTSGIFIALCSILLIIGVVARTFIEKDEEGNPKLAEWRAKKLLKELKDLDEAEQYVLKAKRDGVFPCYSCIHSSQISLLKGQVYKYGVTTKGQQGRYAKSLEGKNLVYIIQLSGSISECLKEEKLKIYYYALLPENLSRTKPLIRPPGNHIDR